MRQMWPAAAVAGDQRIPRRCTAHCHFVNIFLMTCYFILATPHRAFHSFTLPKNAASLLRLSPLSTGE